MILSVVGRPSRERAAVAVRLAVHLNAVVVDGALELCWNRTSRGPDAHDVLARRASPIEAVCEDTSVAILPCGRPLNVTTRTGRGMLEAVEREYDTVLIDCPAADPDPLALTDGTILVTTPATARSHPLATDGIEITAIALLNTATTIERLEQLAPVTPIPAILSLPVSMTDTDPVERSTQRAFRSLANSVHASIRS